MTLVDLVGEPLGFLDARAGGRAQVQQELPGVHAREKSSGRALP